MSHKKKNFLQIFDFIDRFYKIIIDLADICMQMRLEETEQSGLKTAKKAVQKLEQRVVELEMEVESEARKGEETTKTMRKHERRAKELQTAVEEESKVRAGLQDTIDKLQQKMKALARQVEEAVRAFNINHPQSLSSSSSSKSHMAPYSLPC